MRIYIRIGVDSYSASRLHARARASCITTLYFHSGVNDNQRKRVLINRGFEYNWSRVYFYCHIVRAVGL